MWRNIGESEENWEVWEEVGKREEVGKMGMWKKCVEGWEIR